MRRKKLIAMAVAMIALFIVLATADYTTSASQHFGFVVGVVTGFFTLAVTVLVIDEWVENRSNARWKQVASVGFRDVGSDARDISASIAALYVDRPEVPPERSQLPGVDLQRLSPLGEIRRMPDGKVELLADLGVEFSLLPQPDGRNLPHQRILFLLGKAAWVEVALAEVERHLRAQQSTVARWGSLMMQSTESRDLLNSFASLYQDIYLVKFGLDRVQAELRSPEGATGDSEARGEALKEAVWEGLWILDWRSRLVTNRCWQLANGGRFQLLLPMPGGGEPKVTLASEPSPKLMALLGG